jgi:hypothetical protein
MMIIPLLMDDVRETLDEGMDEIPDECIGCRRLCQRGVRSTRWGIFGEP